MENSLADVPVTQELAAKFHDVEENLKVIRFNIEEAAVKSGRNPDDVILMAVTKTVPVEVINHALSLGIDYMGENRVQELNSKYDSLTREGKLANAIRPGGPQYEDGIDVALSPDKKSLYMLSQINVRDNVPYTCPDNIFDSWTDFYAPANWASRKGNYTLLNVFCPENNGGSANYSKDYKGIFASSMLVKYAMPEINPNRLPYFTVGEAYSASVSLANAQGKVRMFPLGQSGDVTFDGENISGTFDTDVPRYAGVLAIDSVGLPGDITYYE